MFRRLKKIINLKFTDNEKKLMLNKLNKRLDKYEKLRKINLDYNVIPPLLFYPHLIVPENPSRPLRKNRLKVDRKKISKLTSRIEDLAFLPVTHLSKLIQQRMISSLDLTRMYLSRMKRFNPFLHCAITVTESLALKQAEKADKEISKGIYIGVLHGIPWGVKDILETKKIRTTWGSFTL
jgi:hypothetical protein